MSPARRALSIVPAEPEPVPAQEAPKDIYAEARRAALDSERWRKLHERSDRSPAISLPARIRRLCHMRGGVRRETGGHKFEERA